MISRHKKKGTSPRFQPANIQQIINVGKLSLHFLTLALARFFNSRPKDRLERHVKRVNRVEVQGASEESIIPLR